MSQLRRSAGPGPRRVSQLAEAWLQAAAAVVPSGDAGDLTSIGHDLLARYAEPHRRYHDVAHLDDVLRHVDALARHAAAPDVVRVAAWFHDAVYDPRATDNEERSAQLAEELLPARQVDAAVVNEVARLVRVTAAHAPDAGDANAAVLCDADLAILASPDGVYAAYVAAVRAEYAHLEPTAFNRGRAQVLSGLVGRKHLFSTPTARRDWEQAARTNLVTELAALAVVP